jgi:hypothetical protein
VLVDAGYNGEAPPTDDASGLRTGIAGLTAAESAGLSDVFRYMRNETYCVLNRIRLPG